MSDNKKYYYLKIKDNFFDSEEMKILESQKNGVEYQNFYLKLCLLSLKSEGRLIFKDCLPYDVSMLSTVLRTNIDTVKTAIGIFRKLGLIDIMESGLIFMSDIQSLIGSGSSEGDRKKVFREKIKEQKLLEGGQMSENRPPELELELELELDKEIRIKEKTKKIADKSALTDDEKKLKTLLDDYFTLKFKNRFNTDISKNKVYYINLHLIVKEKGKQHSYVWREFERRINNLDSKVSSNPEYNKMSLPFLYKNWDNLLNPAVKS